MQETVMFSGTIVCERQRVECQVRATKTTLDEDRAVFSGYTIIESDGTDGLPDGAYDLLANGERIRFRRSDGRFLSRS
jgi:hypothetical protein